MAGRKQHEIPRLFQRGFLIPTSADAERIFVFRRGGRSFDRNIEKVGYGEDFYSSPAADGERTLDDDITDYEKHLSGLVRTLRAVAPGDEADGSVAAEIIVHLTFRNAHLREVFTLGAQGMLGVVTEVMQDDELLRQFLGLDGPTGSDKLLKQIVDNLMADPRAQDLGIPMAVFERLILALVREHFPALMSSQRPMMLAAFGAVLGEAPQIAKESHNKALATLPTKSNERETWLRKLVWRVVESPIDLALPDCVALGVDTAGRALPFATSGVKDIQEVLLPLSSRRLLVGTAVNVSPTFDISHFNQAAAACSHTYFLRASRTPETLALLSSIGTRSTVALDEVIAEGPQGFVGGNEPAPLPSGVFGLALTSPDHSFPITFSGDFDAAMANKVAEAIKAIIFNPTWDLPLGKVSAVTFADDYAEALARIDQHDAALPSPITPEQAQSVGQLVHVRRDGEVLCHLVFDGAIARALVADDDAFWEEGVMVVANLFARAGFSAVYDAAFRNDGTRPMLRPSEAAMHEVTRDAWKAYFAARASAAFAPRTLIVAQENVRAAFRQAVEGVAAAREALHRTDDYGALWRSSSALVETLISHLGMLAGTAHGMQIDAMIEADGLADMLATRGLRAWFEDFKRDLNYTWKRRGQWRSYKELIALGRHAERVLWAFGVFVWEVDDDLRINILPTGMDEAFATALSDPNMF